METEISKCVYQGGVGEITEKKSRFIATVEPVSTEAEAISFFNRKKKEYWDAKHNCTAFTIGRNHELTRCSDDGEPAQTAGRPMLDVLLREDIHNAAVVVTRYFGGVLLGTGGLVRAYQKAVQQGLEQAVIIEKNRGRQLKIDTDYNGLGKIQYLLGKEKLNILNTEYTQGVRISTMVPLYLQNQLVNELTEATGGKVLLTFEGECEYAELDGNLLLFSGKDV